MKVKTSVTLSRDLLSLIDRVDTNRSAFFEKATRAYLSYLKRKQRDTRDAGIINANAKRLNKEAKDVLEYQRVP